MLTEWEKNEAQRRANVARYSVNESDVTIASMVAEEATLVLSTAGLLKGCSELTRKWHADHWSASQDKSRAEAERTEKARLRKEAVAKLSPQELEALGVKASALY